MSIKSIGYGDESGRGGKFVCPNITVKNGTIFEITKGETLPQFEIQTGIVEQQQRINQIGQQFNRQTALYNTMNTEVQSLIANSPLDEYTQLQTDIATLLAQVSNVSQPVMYWSDSKPPSYYVRRGMGIRNTSYNLFSMTVQKTTTHFVSVHLGLSIVSGLLTVFLQDDGVYATNVLPSIVNGTFSQILLKVNGIVVKTMYSIKRTYRCTNIFITGETYISLQKDDVFSVDFDFTNSYSAGNVDTPGGDAAIYAVGAPDSMNGNQKGQITYCAPQTIQNDNSSGVATPSYMGLNRNTSPSVKVVQF